MLEKDPVVLVSNEEEIVEFEGLIGDPEMTDPEGIGSPQLPVP